ncbi:hypothetical protein ACNKHO_25140 [Shigella flexneri]
MDHDANIVSVSQREFEQIYPRPGWVEHDPWRSGPHKAPLWWKCWRKPTSVLTNCRYRYHQPA